jgi:hypothetical protein
MELVIVGEGEERPRLEKIIRESRQRPTCASWARSTTTPSRA